MILPTSGAYDYVYMTLVYKSTYALLGRGSDIKVRRGGGAGGGGQNKSTWARLYAHIVSILRRHIIPSITKEFSFP
jgi:hypothetical protein